MAAGLAATDARRLLRSRYLLLGGVIAAALAAPDLVWQAVHGWPKLDVFRALQGAAGHNRAVFWLAQILYTGPALTPVWVAGAIWSLRSPAARRFRPVAIACVTAIGLQFVLGGKAYYPGAAYTFLLAAGHGPARAPAGGPAPDQTSSAGRHGHARGGAAAAMLAGAALAAPVALSVLPARTLHTVPLQKINYDLAETIAWPKLVALVAQRVRLAARRAAAADRDPDRELRRGRCYRPLRARARRCRRPTAAPTTSGCGDRRPRATWSVIAVNVDPALLRREFAQVRLVATFWNGLGVSDDEQGAQIFVATGLRSSWAQAWPAFRDYS